MSRFFRGDSSSESEEESSSGEETTPVQKQQSRFDESSSGDDEPVKRVVRSQQDKLSLEYEDILTKIKLHIKGSEYTAFPQDLDKLDKALTKTQQRETAPPRTFFKALAMLEDVVKVTLESGIKLSGPNQKSFNAFKQKIKKYNVAHQKQIAEYRQNIDKDHKIKLGSSEGMSEGESEEEEESEEESDEEPVKPAAKKAAAKAPAKAASPAPAPSAGSKYGRGFFVKKGGDEESESSSDDDDNMSESESDEASSDEEDRSNKWKVKKDDKKEAQKEDKKPRKREQKAQKKSDDESERPVKGKKEIVELSPEQVDKRLVELLANRGKRGTDKMEQIENLEALLPFVRDDAQLMTILMNLVSAQFDASPSVATHMPVNLWKGGLANLQKIVAVLNRNPTLILAETEEQEKEGEDGTSQVVVGNLLAYIERLDDEFIKGLQNIDDPHTHEYVQRLQDEQGFLELIENVQAYYTRSKDSKRAARVAFRRMEHLYYKSDKEATALKKSAAAAKAAGENKEVKEEVQTNNTDPADNTHTQLIHDLAVLIYANGDDRLRARAMLMHIYHHALHDRFYEARDMMLMSHLQESIHLMDISTQILFNRTMVQIGLCAFRKNLIWEAHAGLADICGVSRVKELLAQGVTTRFQDKNVEQEKIEKKRQVPFHMHINLELLEVVHLISAMLLEVPNMAANPFDPKRKVISRTFRRLMDYFDRQVFTGPPENNRDFVAAAAKALAQGNWKTTEQLLFSIKSWALMPNVDVVKANIKKRIQEEGLRTYLFSFGDVYDSISLDQLSVMFELDKNHVHSLVSKMMINEELKASWDQPSGAIVMHRVEPSKLQYLALQFAEKASVFVENNERMLEAKTGGYYNKDQQGKGQGQQKDGRNWQEGGYRQPYQQYQRKPYGNDNRNNREGGGDRRDRGDRRDNNREDRRDRGGDRRDRGDGGDRRGPRQDRREGGHGGHREGGHREGGHGGHREGGHRDNHHRDGGHGGHREGGRDGGRDGGQGGEEHGDGFSTFQTVRSTRHGNK